jgi:hypothetical protein
MKMLANYQPIVTKMLLEAGDPWTVPIDKIKEKLTQLNFGRKDFVIQDAVDAVSTALKEFVTFTSTTATLRPDKFANAVPDAPAEIPECLKICGKKIADWHINKIVKNNFQLWFCTPGSTESGYKFWPEFKEHPTTIGIGYAVNEDLSKLSPQDIRDKYGDGSDYFNKYDKVCARELNSIKEIQAGDIIMCTKAKSGIFDFAIALDDYDFVASKPDPPSYPHRIKVEWLNVGPFEDKYDAAVPGIGKIIKDKEKFIRILLGKTYQEKNTSNRSMAVAPHTKGFLNWGSSVQFAMWDNGKYACFIKKFAELDGLKADDENIKKYLNMMHECGLRKNPASTQEKNKQDWDSYTPLFALYGFGRYDRDIFELTDSARAFLTHDKIDFFLLNQMLKFQFPNGAVPGRSRKPEGEGYKIKPFVFFLKLLSKMIDEGLDGHLSADEIFAVRIIPTHEDDDVQKALDMINGFRNGGEVLLEIEKESACDTTITRFFDAFHGTGLLTYTKGRMDKNGKWTLAMGDEQHKRVKEILSLLGGDE